MLPKVNSIRKNIFKLNNQNIELVPWTNYQLVQFESLKDSSEKSKLVLENLKIDNLIIPYISNYESLKIKKFSLIDYRRLFVELYKLSKGNMVDFQFKCKYCSTEENDIYSLGLFDLTKNYKFTELKKTTIETTDFKFILKTSNYDIIKDTEEDTDLKSSKYLYSYVKEVIDKNKTETYKDFTLDEITNWFLNELDSKNYSEFNLEFSKIQPSINIEGDFICEHCGKTNHIKFEDIPDFSICYWHH